MAPFGLKLGRIEARGLNNMLICLPTPFRAKFYLKIVRKTGLRGLRGEKDYGLRIKMRITGYIRIAISGVLTDYGVF